jgi:predicted ATPase/DNA-binding winged helix-turn-helix (wHTH) protein
VYRVGDHEVDVRRREVRRGGTVVHLEPQAFDLLVYLIEHRDEVVTKHDLLDGVWGHRFVSEAAITTRIKEIRRALDDDGTRQHTIRNVRGIGYRFVAELDALDDAVGVPSGGTPTLIGRDDDLAVITSLVETSPVVTIVGPGGVGKSTIAMAVAAECSNRVGDGVHPVELSSLTRGAHVLPAIARGLGIVLDPETEGRALATIGRLDAVLVLDNCEHLVDDVAAVIERALATPGTRLRVLATSRVRLGVSGEQVIGLAPLGREAALELFESRVRAIRPTWSNEDVGLDRVDAVLDQVDRLPLTIEMAAARLGSMTFDELHAAVERRGSLPTQMTHRTPSRRHRTLESLVEWSGDLLDDTDRRTFEDCSVFAGSFTSADAIAALSPGAPDDVVASIGELTDRSLLAVDLDGPVARYRMLESIKAVGRRWLAASGRSHEAAQRHALAVADAVEQVDRVLRSADEAAGRRRLDAVVAEIRQAHTWAVEHEPLLAERLARHLHLASYGRLWSEPATWSSALLERCDADAIPASRLLLAGAEVNAGALDSAQVTLTDILVSGADPTITAIAHELMSDLSLYAGDLDACRQHAAALADLGEHLADAHMVAMAATNDSMRLAFAGEADAARDRLDSVDPDGLAPTNKAWLAYARGEVCDALGDHAGAVTAYQRAIDIAASVGNPFVMSVGQSSLAHQLARAGRRRQAVETYRACLDGHRRHGNLVHAVTTLRNLAGWLATLGEYREAAIIAAAVSQPVLRPTYGREAEDRANADDSIRRMVGADLADEWAAAGAELDVVTALERADTALRGLLVSD